MNTPILTNATIVMATSKQFLVDYHLKSSLQGEGHHLEGASLKVVMDKFTTLASPTCQNFVYGSNNL